MSREVQKYRDYARECLRQADQASNSARRDKLLELARAWADAATMEHDEATAYVLNGPTSPPTVRRRVSG